MGVDSQAGMRTGNNFPHVLNSKKSGPIEESVRLEAGDCLNPC